MTIRKYKILYLLLLFIWIPCYNYSAIVGFATENKFLESYYDREDILIVASTGRSGSTLLTHTITAFAPQYSVIKSHLLPPTSNRYKGKILFIFSNPDRAAESALHLTIKNAQFGALHFHYMTTSDKQWLAKIGDTTKQTKEHNLLAYDALGCYKHLFEWLYQTKSSHLEQANILAIKYENLWDPETIDAIKKFLQLEYFELPPKKMRGYSHTELDLREITFRKLYNVGTPNDPKYKAYNKARNLWQTAPAFQYLKTVSK